MNWIGLSTVFFSATVKFMFSPLLGPVLGLSYFETYMANAFGALTSMTFFYFAADYLNRLSLRKKVERRRRAIEAGEPIKQKKIVTKKNKLIIRLKNKVGVVTFALLAPFFMSIPIGSIVTAKFFGKRKGTYPIMIIGIFLCNTITVSLIYLLKYEAEHIL